MPGMNSAAASGVVSISGGPRTARQYRRRRAPVLWKWRKKGSGGLRTNCPGASHHSRPNNGARSLQDAVDLFLKQEDAGRVLGRAREIHPRVGPAQIFCESQGVHSVQRINRDTLTEFCATWAEAYPSTITRAKVRERLRGFLKYCYEAPWLRAYRRSPKSR